MKTIWDLEHVPTQVFFMRQHHKDQALTISRDCLANAHAKSRAFWAAVVAALEVDTDEAEVEE